MTFTVKCREFSHSKDFLLSSDSSLIPLQLGIKPSDHQDHQGTSTYIRNYDYGWCYTANPGVDVGIRGRRGKWPLWPLCPCLVKKDQRAVSISLLTGWHAQAEEFLDKVKCVLDAIHHFSLKPELTWLQGGYWSNWHWLRIWRNRPCKLSFYSTAAIANPLTNWFNDRFSL